MITAIVAEYNPFHKGHLFHIEETIKNTECEYLIVVLSGNFVQRGEPAIFNKAIRTEMALRNGVDMVLELPVEYATSSADVFAYGAMDIINKSGIVDCLSFGSESGSIENIDKAADLLSDEPEEFKNLLKIHLRGNSYPAARSKAISQLININNDILSSSNNILAIEYIKALKQLNSKIKPYTVQRSSNTYNQQQLTGDISSATAIRHALINDRISALKAVPENCHKFYELENIPSIDDYSYILKYILLNTTQDYLRNIADITEGLENRIYNNWNCQSISELLNKIKTKRYTYTKLQRALLHIILDVQKTDQLKPVEYIRVLGFKKERSELLKKLICNSVVPVITNVKEKEKLLKREIRATDIYNISMGVPLGNEYMTPMVII